MQPGRIISKWSLLSAKWAYQLLATSAEIFCHHSFGERYRPRLLASFAFTAFYAFCVRAVFPTVSPLIAPLCWVNTALLVWHFFSIHRRQFVSIHTYSSGASWSFWGRFGFGTLISRAFVEPGFLICLGVVLSNWDVAVAAWLQCAGVCLAVKEAISAWNRRHRVLDAIDTRIESEQMNEAIRRRTTPKGRRAQSTHTVQASRAHPLTTPLQTEMFSNLDRGLQDLFSHSQSISPLPPERPGRNPQNSGGPLNHLPRIVSPRRDRPE